MGDCDFVCKLDPDDYVEPGAFKIIKDAIAKFPDCSLWFSDHYCHTEYKYRENKTWRWVEGKNRLATKQSQIFAPHHIVVFRRDALEPNLRLISGIKSGYQYLLNYCCMLGNRVCYIDSALYHWHIHRLGAHRAYLADNGRKTAKEMASKIKNAVKSTLDTNVDWELCMYSPGYN